MWSIGYGCCGRNGGTVILNNYTTSWLILHHANMGPDSRSPHQLFTQYSGVGSIAHYRKGVFVQYISTTFCRTVIASSISSAMACMAPSGLLTISPQADALHLKFCRREVSEVAILRHLKQRQLDHGGLNGQGSLMEFLDDFEVETLKDQMLPNGTHQCIVTEVLGPSTEHRC